MWKISWAYYVKRVDLMYLTLTSTLDIIMVRRKEKDTRITAMSLKNNFRIPPIFQSKGKREKENVNNSGKYRNQATRGPAHAFVIYKKPP